MRATPGVILKKVSGAMVSCCVLPPPGALVTTPRVAGMVWAYSKGPPAPEPPSSSSRVMVVALSCSTVVGSALALNVRGTSSIVKTRLISLVAPKLLPAVRVSVCSPALRPV